MTILTITLPEILKCFFAIIIAALAISVAVYNLLSLFKNLKSRKYKDCLKNACWIYGMLMFTAFALSILCQWMLLPPDTNPVILWLLFLVTAAVSIYGASIYIKNIVTSKRKKEESAWQNRPVMCLLFWICICLYVFDGYFAKLF